MNFLVKILQLIGEEINDPVLCIHGIFDNSGTFERLIPHLPKDYFYICIDLPSHGKSSQWPEHSLIHTTDNLLVYKVIVDYFKYKQYTILGHSYGGQIGIMFAQIYPEHVKKIILLDTIHIYPISTEQLPNVVKSRHDDYFSLMNKLKTGSPPEFTYEEALEKIQRNRRYGEISREAAEALLRRAMVPTANGKYIISGDQRIKFTYNPIMDFRYILEFLKKSPVKCPVLVVLGTESKLQNIYFKDVLKRYKSYKNFRIVMVEGHHDVHNVSPEAVAPHIIRFLRYRSSKL